MSSHIVRLGTRASNLAMTQTRWVAKALKECIPDLEIEIVPITTEGDRRSKANQQPKFVFEQLDSPVGVFVKELENALLSGTIDAAVHSLKDLPAKLPDGLTIGAVPHREDARDAFILPQGRSPFSWDDLAENMPPQARIGSTSLRRITQLLLLRQDLKAKPIRGNVETRISRLDEGVCDVLVLAAAGLRRLDLHHRISCLVPYEAIVPAPGQGALAIECRADDNTIVETLRQIDQPHLRAAVWAERAFMEATEAGCRLPVGALALPADESMESFSHTLIGFFAESVGEDETSWTCMSGSLSISAPDQPLPSVLETYTSAGEQLAQKLREELASGAGQRIEIHG